MNKNNKEGDSVRYDQMVVAEGVHEETAIEELYSIFKKMKFKKPKIVGIVETLPDIDKEGNHIEGTGGRKDLMFLINNKDINKFSIWRLYYGLRWWEDIFFNQQQHIYPDEFKQKYPPRW